MVASHKKLLRRIDVIKRFQEITKAIRFITGGELAKVRKHLNRRFICLISFVPLFSTEYLELPISEKINLKNDIFDDLYLNDRNLVLPISDDRTSCGSHNINIMYRTSELVDDLLMQNTKVSIYPIGLQGRYYCEDLYKRLIIGSTTGMGDIKFGLDTCYYYASKFISLDYDKYYLIYNRFYSLQQQYTNIYCLCSYNLFVKSLLKNSFLRNSTFFDAIIDKSVYTNFVEDLYAFGFSMFLLDAFNENKYSFLGARFAAMDAMINNSQEYLERLITRYNRIRQDSITTEIVEIVSCADVVMSTKE